jgi:hypothetical protein
MTLTGPGWLVVTVGVTTVMIDDTFEWSGAGGLFSYRMR